MSIRSKIILAVCLIVLLSTVISTFVISQKSSETARQLTHSIAEKTADHHALIVTKELEEAMETARVLELVFWNLKQSANPDRDLLSAILLDTLQDDPDLFGVWTAWEPNAFDGRDAEFENAPGHDSTGRVLTWWYRRAAGSEDMVLEPSMGAETSEWYSIPRDRGRETLYGPYDYTSQLSEDMLLIETIVPIIHDGKFYGVVGVEYRMKTLQEKVMKLTLMESGYAALIANNGLYVTHPNPDLVGTHLGNSEEDVALLKAVRSGKSYHAEVAFDPVSGDEVYRVCSPVLVGETESPWGLVVNIPISVVAAAAIESRNWTLLVGITSGLLLIAVLMVMVSRMTNPIVQMSNTLKNAVSAQTGQIKELDVSRRDEVGQLANSFNRMAKDINQSRADLECANQTMSALNAVLKNSEENLRITLNSIGDAVISVDSKGTIATMNPVAEQLTGWTSEEAVGCPMNDVFKIVNALTRKPVESPVEKVMATGKIAGLANHTVLLSKEGHEYQIADSAAPIRAGSGEVLGVVLVFRDVTEEYALQEQLRHSQKMDAIGQLAGGVAHDFNNILAGIMGAAEILETMLPPDPKAEKMLDLIIKTSERAAILTRKLLTFARKQRSVSICLDVHKVLNDTVVLLKSSIDRRIAVDVNFATEPAFVIGDPSQLQGAFLNLGINAAHAMPMGGTISISSEFIDLDVSYCESSLFQIEPGAYLKVEVRDTGTGIPQENLPHIFEPFFTTKKQGEGTGLGLAAVYGTIQHHHGAMNVYSEEGVGTSFHILLPLSEQEMATRPLPTRPVRGSGRILVVDDEDIMRTTSRAILESLGYEVLLARDGHEGLELFEKDPSAINLVLLDMMMPHMNGRDCFEAMQKIDPGVRVVLSSGFFHEEDLEQMKAAGLCGFISKPFRSVALSQVVHDALEG